jgi:hypothetical protein
VPEMLFGAGSYQAANTSGEMPDVFQKYRSWRPPRALLSLRRLQFRFQGARSATPLTKVAKCTKGLVQFDDRQLKWSLPGPKGGGLNLPSLLPARLIAKISPTSLEAWLPARRNTGHGRDRQLARWRIAQASRGFRGSRSIPPSLLPRGTFIHDGRRRIAVGAFDAMSRHKFEHIRPTATLEIQ